MLTLTFQNLRLIFESQEFLDDAAVQQGENHMKEINGILKNLRIGSNAESIRGDLSREDGDFTFSEISQCIIHEMGNVELFELGKTTATVQCQSCYHYVLEGIVFCECGYCLRPYEDTSQRRLQRCQETSLSLHPGQMVEC